MPRPTIYWKKDCIRLIDQTKLPVKFQEIDCRTLNSLWWAIKKLKVRGAPALGVAGALGIVLGINKKKFSTSAALIKEVKKIAKYLGTSRPTAVNLFWALERMVKLAEENKKKSSEIIKKLLIKEAGLIIKEDQDTCRKMGSYAAKLVKNGDNLLTHCNAGALATYDYGTALGVFYQAKKARKKFMVYADETRPLLQGSRLTIWELMQAKISCKLICDNMAGALMSKGKVDRIFVGSDRIAANGDCANKTGTYGLAVNAHYHKVPFYVVAPISTIDFNISSGKKIPIEERAADEVRYCGSTQIAPKKALVYNPAFDITPAKLITGIITEKGIFKPSRIKNLKKYGRT